MMRLLLCQLGPEGGPAVRQLGNLQLAMQLCSGVKEATVEVAIVEEATVELRDVETWAVTAATRPSALRTVKTFIVERMRENLKT